MKLTLALAMLAATLSISALADGEGPVNHVVMFKFKEDADKAAIENVEKEFAKLKDKVPGITKLEWGTDSSPEKMSKGFTHIWIVTFKDEAARNVYLKHPDHMAFVKLLPDVLEEAKVMDFIPKK